MKRRQFLKNIACTGALVTIGGLGSFRKTYANTNEQFWVFFHAGGGWDPTNFWDPKGSDVMSTGGSVNRYHSSEIRSAGNIRYAAVPEGIETEDMLHTFTQKHYRNMMVFNGINQGTNGHGTGSRVASTGMLSKGTPTMAAMLAAPYASTKSMAFIANGHSYTGGIVPASKVLSSANYSRLSDPDNYLDSASVFGQVNANKRRLLDNLLSDSNSAQRQQRLEELLQARLSSGDLPALLDKIPGTLNGNKNKAAAEVVAAAFSSGLSASATFSIGGFDTHSDNDQRQFKQGDELLGLVDYLWDQLTLQGVADRTTIVIHSDIGRRPSYGNGNPDGKGHWPVTSKVIMGAGIRGNQVIGMSDDDLKSMKINPYTFEADETGIQLNPGSIYDAVRRLTGIADSENDLRYPLNAEFMDIFA